MCATKQLLVPPSVHVLRIITSDITGFFWESDEFSDELWDRMKTSKVELLLDFTSVRTLHDHATN